MTVRERWVDLVHRAAVGNQTTRGILTPIGALFFGLFTAAFVFLAVLTDRVLPLQWPISTNISLLLAATILAIGAAITTWSVVHFAKARGTPVPFNPPPALVDSGPYRYARNPMLTGVFLLSFGIGFAIRSPSLVLFFTPLYILVHAWELKNIEEPELVKRLGEPYLEYRRRTPMFIPRIRPMRKHQD